jgi:LacI family transcriptional regulator
VVEQAVRHLVELGHTKIAHVGGTQTVSTGLVRYHSFVSWMLNEGLDADPSRIVFAEWFREDRGAEAFRELFARDTEFTAVVCGNDLIALGGYDVLRERGLRCPDDLSIVGYNDTPNNDKFSHHQRACGSALSHRSPCGRPACRGHRGGGDPAGRRD